MKKWMFLISVLAFALAACSSSSKTADNAYRSSQDERPLVDPKYSLQADRRAMEEMRGDIPADKKRENDELALILGLMSETKKAPSEIRNQFDSILRKKRSLFDKDMTKERETFTKEERKKREEFLKSQKEQRDVFGRSKASREERAEFFKDLDGKRSEYFSVERDRRSDFESDVRERRKSFEDYAREKQNEFNQEHRAYQKRYDEWKKQAREKEKEKALGQTTGAAITTGGLTPADNFGGPGFNPVTSPNPYADEAAALEAELEAIKQKSGTNLESGQ